MWEDNMTKLSRPTISKREGNDIYPVLVFNVAKTAKNRHFQNMWFDAPDHYIKTARELDPCGVVSEVFHSRVADILDVPAVHNDFGYIKNADPVKEAVASRLEKRPGKIIDEMSVITNRYPDSRLYKNPTDSDDPEFVETDLAYLLDTVLKNTTDDFDRELVKYYLFSQYIHHNQQIRFNNVPIWINADAKRYKRKSLVMAPAYDFECAGIPQIIGVTPSRPLNRYNLDEAVKRYPNTVRDFMERLSLVRSNAFEKICDFSAVKNFLPDGVLAPRFGERVYDHYQKRTADFQNEYAKTK